MTKYGLIHDYDLMSNQEETSRGIKCAICETENTRTQWSDYSGEAMCCVCGCPYQLKWGNEKQKLEGKYPYLGMKESFIPIARKFWNEKGLFVHYGLSVSRRDGMDALIAWLKINHPEEVEG